MKQDAHKAKIISLISQKGGVGKSAFIRNFMVYLNKLKIKTLLIDKDIQITSQLWFIFRTNHFMTAKHEKLNSVPDELAYISSIRLEEYTQNIDKYNKEYDVILIDTPGKFIDGIYAIDPKVVDVFLTPILLEPSCLYSLETINSLLEDHIDSKDLMHIKDKFYFFFNKVVDTKQARENFEYANGVIKKYFNKSFTDYESSYKMINSVYLADKYYNQGKTIFDSKDIKTLRVEQLTSELFDELISKFNIHEKN